MAKQGVWSLLLCAHRKKAHINQDEFADRLRVSQGTVSNWERGESLPDLSLVADMSDALGLRGDDRRTFIEEAFLAHAPDRVRAIVADLRAEVDRCRTLLTQRGIDFPGKR